MDRGLAIAGAQRGEEEEESELSAHGRVAVRGVVTSTSRESLRTHLYHPSRAQMLGVLRIVHNEQRLSMHRH